MNSVSALQDNAFSRLTYNEKIAIKHLKRPMPKLRLENKQTVKGKEVIRKFKMDVYQRNDWICGCEVKSAFFCFPCVLFGGDPSWSTIGVRDLIHLSAKITKHENSEVHLRNVFSLRMLGRNNIQNVLDSSYRRAIEQHNEQVTKNRHALNLIINCIRFCGAFELALQGRDERETSNVIFRELINFTSELDKSLRDHIEAAPVFKGSSKTIQNELLDAMLMVYHEQVSSEIKAADFISVIADEMTDVSNQFQLVIVLRYIVNGRPVERFWKFLIPNRGDDANSLSASILNEINSLVGDPQKVIAQSYDGAAVMSGAIHGVQRHLRDHYPRANFVHCYAHETNLIISHATSTSLNCRIFFANLNGLCQFFSASPQQRLEEFLPRSSKINTTVNAIYEHRLGIIEALERIEEEASLQTTIREAGANLRILGEENFIYWLSFFHKIMPHVEKFFTQLQNVKIKNNLDNFERAIAKIRTEIADADDQLVIKEENDSDRQPSKRRRLTDGGQRWRETIEVCDIISQEIKTRFRKNSRKTALKKRSNFTRASTKADFELN